MTISLPAQTETAAPTPPAKLIKSPWLQLLAALTIGVAIALVWDGAREWPADWVIPIKLWITDFFTWLDKTATLGLFTMKQATRTGFVGSQPAVGLVGVSVL